MKEIIICPDIHCRSFYKSILNIKDKPIVFLGDYLDPYEQDGVSFEDGFANLEEIIDFAKSNSNVTLLTGNHDCSYIWSNTGTSRFNSEFYYDAHTLFRDNIDLFKPVLLLDNVLFSHAGISKDWLEYLLVCKSLQKEFSTQDIINYINNEWKEELESEIAIKHFGYSFLKSNIFNVGWCRGGDSTCGGPFWCDLSEMENSIKEIQIFGHSQLRNTGAYIDVKRFQPKSNTAYCCDSRAIFVYKDNQLSRF